MSNRSWESAVDEQTAFSDIEDTSIGRRGASPAVTNSCKMRDIKPNKNQQDECNAITVAIPADIVGDVLKRMNPREAVQLSSVCRYWRAPALACNPTLRPIPWMLDPAMDCPEGRLDVSFQSVVDASVFEIKLNPVNFSPGPWWSINDTWYGWLLITQHTPERKLLLLNPFSSVLIDLPPYRSLQYVLCITSDPAAPGCAVIAADTDKDNLMVWRPGDSSWTMGVGEECRNNKSSLAVWLKEQLFLLDRVEGRLLSLQLFPLQCKDNMPVSLCEDLGDLYSLVASQGDLLVISVKPVPCTDKSCLFVRVFRLDWDTMAFVAVESLGTDRAVFLGSAGESISVSAVETGCTAECIYIRNIAGCILGDKFSWHCYNLKTGELESFPNLKFPQEPRQLWITPTLNNNCSYF